MGLVTSTAGLEGLNLQRGNASRTSQKGDVTFQSIFNSKINSGSESMDAIFDEAARTYGISVDLIKAVAKAESSFNPNAVSKAGAIGVMQLMPATARSLGVTDPYDARQNIMGGAKYLKENLDRFNGNVNLALAAYNAGPNSVQKYGGIPPYKETQNYVKTVTSYMNGSPIYSGKMVATNRSSGQSDSLYGTYSQLAALTGMSSSSGKVGSLYGTDASGNLYDTSSSRMGSVYGSSYSQLAGLYGLNQNGLGTGDTLGMLLGSASVSTDGDTISMSKESYVSLIQMLRLQMMMNASREVGTINL